MSQATLNEGGRGVFLPKQSANIYTMLLILSFLSISIGCLFLYLEMHEYGGSIKVSSDAKVPPPPPPKAVPEPEAPPAENPAPAAATPAGAPAAAPATAPSSFDFHPSAPLAHCFPRNIESDLIT